MICSDFCSVCIDFVMTFVVFSDVYSQSICDDFCSLL